MATYDLASTTPTTLAVGDILNCTYSGTYKSITLPAGTYKLECWGAKGGYYKSSYSANGGNGGYSYGVLKLTTETLIYLYVGQMPTSKTGGFNGGGNTNSYGGGGGGATDIRIASTSIYARVIVAGAGGGTGYSNTLGGIGGGETGFQGGNGSATGGYGATQNAGGSYYTAGSFGQANSNTSNGGGGGGGWYGGGSGIGSGTDSGGGGGSGYVYNSNTYSNYPSGCLLNSMYYLTNSATVAGNTSFIDYSGSTVTGHSGNGDARITILTIASTINMNCNIGGSIKTVSSLFCKIGGVWKEASAVNCKIGGVWK